jgi:hypothetical protein
VAIDFQNISEHLKEVLLNLKHMSPMQRFNEVSKPRFELQWQTVAGRYGIEKLERQGWMIPDREILGPTSKTLPLMNADHADRQQNQDSPRRRGDAEETGELENQNPKANTLPLIPASAGQMNADHADQQQKQESPQSGFEIGGSGDRVIGGSESQTRNLPRRHRDMEKTGGSVSQDPEAVAAEAIPQEQLNRLYSGDDRKYVERPEVVEERQHSIEMAARIAAGDTQLNGRWQVLRDEEVLQPEVRAEIEERGGIEAVPVNEDFVLARDGCVMYRTQLQHALERELRYRMGVPESWETDKKKILWHKEQLARLEKADAAPRCEHIYSDGTTCQAPKLKTGQWCYAHERMKSVRPKKLNLLPTEDANSIMLNLGDIGRALINDEISEKKAGLLMYNQQLGLIALSRVTFKETDGRLMVREAPEVQEHLPQRARRAQREIQSPQRTQRTQRNNSPVLEGDKADGGSRHTAAEQRSTQQSALSIQPAKQISGSRQAAAEPVNPGLSPHKTTIGFCGDPGVHRTKTAYDGDPGLPPHRANCGCVGPPGLLPHRTKTASDGDPGIECAKSNGFGVEAGGGGVASQVQTGRMPDRTDREHT